MAQLNFDNCWEGICPVCGNKIHAVDENYKPMCEHKMHSHIGDPMKCGCCWENLIVNENLELEIDPDNLWDKIAV